MNMKFTLLAILSATVLSLCAQQPANGGFNTWTDATNPNGWSTWATAVPGYASTLVTQDNTNKIEGTSSAKIMTDSIQAGPTLRLIPGFTSLGTVTYSPPSPPKFTGVPFTFRPDTVLFAYKYTTEQTDTGLFLMQFIDGSVSLTYTGQLETTNNGWVSIYFLMNDTAYLNNISTTPDSLLLLFQSSYGKGAKDNSTLWVDNVRFGYVAAPSFVEEIDNSIQVTVYPNPAGNVAQLQLSENVNGSVMVFDAQGRVVTHELLIGNNHLFHVGEWANGLYSYAVFNQQGKAISKGKLSVAK